MLSVPEQTEENLIAPDTFRADVTSTRPVMEQTEENLIAPDTPYCGGYVGNVSWSKPKKT